MKFELMPFDEPCDEGCDCRYDYFKILSKTDDEKPVFSLEVSSFHYSKDEWKTALKNLEEGESAFISDRSFTILPGKDYFLLKILIGDSDDTNITIFLMQSEVIDMVKCIIEGMNTSREYLQS